MPGLNGDFGLGEADGTEADSAGCLPLPPSSALRAKPRAVLWDGCECNLGTPPDPREILFRADFDDPYRLEIGNGVASASAFPNRVWERG